MLSSILLATVLEPSLDYLRGADVSFLPQYEALSVTFQDGGHTEDPLKTLSKYGVNLLRLRLWVNPRDGWCSLPRTLEMAKRGKAVGMKLLLNFHYSDSWADPAKQYPPKIWEGLSLTELEERVHAHTREAIEALVRQGTPPHIVQIGNEVRAGMLWPHGDLRKDDWTGFVRLLRAGIRAVRASDSETNRILIMLHHDQGGDADACRYWFDKVKEHGIDFDIIGLSYYPWWHGSFSDLKKNLEELVSTHRKPVMIVETAFPFTLEAQDSEYNFVGSNDQLKDGLRATPADQTQFLRRLHQIVAALPGGKGMGVVYWAPEYVAVPGMPTPCENLCLWDYNRQALPAIRALGGKP